MPWWLRYKQRDLQDGEMKIEEERSRRESELRQEFFFSFVYFFSHRVVVFFTSWVRGCWFSFIARSEWFCCTFLEPWDGVLDGLERDKEGTILLFYTDKILIRHSSLSLFLCIFMHLRCQTHPTIIPYVQCYQSKAKGFRHQEWHWSFCVLRQDSDTCIVWVKMNIYRVILQMPISKILSGAASVEETSTWPMWWASQSLISSSLWNMCPKMKIRNGKLLINCI